MREPSPLTQLAQTLEQLPVYTMSFVFSLLLAILSDPILTALTIASLFLGFITGPLIALSGFFFVYVFIRTINSIANAIGHSGQGLVRTLTSLNQPPLPPSMPTPPTVTPLDTTPPDS